MNRAYMENQIAQLQSMLDRGAFDLHPARDDRDMQIAEILEEAPSLATLALLLSVNPMTLGEQGRIDYMVSMERHSGWLQPYFARSIVAVAGNGGKKPGEISSEVDQAEREEVASARATRDPLKIFGAQLQEMGVASADDLKRIHSQIDEEMDRAVEFGETSPEPLGSVLLTDIFTGADEHGRAV